MLHSAKADVRKDVTSIKTYYMRKLFFILTTLTTVSIFAQEKIKLPPNSAALIYQMPDTLKAVQYYNVLMVDSNSYNKNSLYGSYFSEGIIGTL